MIMLQINQFIDHDDRVVTVVGAAMFLNKWQDGDKSWSSIYFYEADGQLQDGTAVTIMLYTDCSPEADEHAHRVYDVDGNERWWITPIDLVRGLRDGSYTLTYCGDGTQTERAKMYEEMSKTAFDDDSAELFGAVFDDMDMYNADMYNADMHNARGCEL